ncbi:MAG: lytic transglycosylase domain-containing protein [Psychromonas sp.]
MPKNAISILLKINFALLLSLLLSKAVWADIYVFIDDNGDQHFSEEKINEQYTLLLRSDTNQARATFRNWKDKDYSNTHLPKNKTLQRQYHSLILQAANKYQLETAFLHAVITAESSYQRYAVSSAGAQGLMQLMPVTAKRFGVDDPFDPEQSINAGALYLRKLLNEFKSKELALAAYNSGEGTVRRYKRQIPPYPETQRYVKKVLEFYQYYKQKF